MEDGMRMMTETRRRRAGMWIAGLAVIAAIAATYRFTRPPELVWWTSPAIGNTGRHVRVLVPQGWEAGAPIDLQSQTDLVWYRNCELIPTDHRPMFLSRLLPRNQEHAVLAIRIIYYRQGQLPGWVSSGPIPWFDIPGQQNLVAEKNVATPDYNTMATVWYVRDNRTAFNATQAAICNSLRIE
jgi:hypothetical protein